MIEFIRKNEYIFLFLKSDFIIDDQNIPNNFSEVKFILMFDIHTYV
jgi:hypothetical protein